MKAHANAYPAAVFALSLAALLVPSLVMVAATSPFPTGPGSGTASLGALSDSRALRNATNLIADGSFDAVPGPWTYVNGTTGTVSASRDPAARARLGHTTSILRFDSMDDVLGPTPWTSVVSSRGGASSNVSQEGVIHVEGSGALQDDVTIFQNNEWGGAMRDDPLPWNWSGYDRLAIWINKATPGTLWTWVYIEDEAGRPSWGLYALVNGWYRYAFDLTPPFDASQVNFIEIAFAGSAGTTGTVYVDDIVLFNSTGFAETASVSQTFTKSTVTGGSPDSLRLSFDLQTTSSMEVESYLQVAINNTAEWSETPVVAGARTISVDLSGNVALRGTGSFTLSFSLRLNRTGWAEPSMTAWIDNVTLVIPGTLARIQLSPDEAFVPLAQTALFTAQGWDTDGNPVPLTAMNWSSTIGQIVSSNATTAMLQAPNLPGTGIVSANRGNITGNANVTVGAGGTGLPTASPWDALLWPGSAILALVLGATALLVMRRSAIRTFRIEDLFLINHEGLLIAHATRRPDAHGDEDILAGMLTAIMSFAQDSFREEREGLKRFEIGNKKVALEASEHVYVAAIGSGVVGTRLSTSMRDFLADIEGFYGERFQSWSGMSEDLLGIEAMVATFAQRGRYRRGEWRIPPPGPGPRPPGSVGARSRTGGAQARDPPIRPRM